MFCKGAYSVHDHGANIIIPKVAQDDQADYEGELVRNSTAFFSKHLDTG